MGDLITFKREEGKMKRGILWSMWWSWVTASSGWYHDLWAKRIGGEMRRVYHFHS